MDFPSRAAKTINCSKNDIDKYLSINVKKHIHNYKKKNNEINNESNKDKMKKINIMNNTAYNYHSRNKSETTLNKLTPSSLCRNRSISKYDNYFIFAKRELAFNRSVKEGKKVFKYNQSTIDDQDIIQLRKIPKMNSLYLTQTLLKRNNTMLPYIDKDKDKSIFDDINITFLKNEKSYTTKDAMLLRTINFKNERQKEMKKNREFIDLKKLVKKHDIISKYNIKEKNVHNYINNLKKYLTDKYTLDIKNEKYKVIKETDKNKLEKIIGKVKDLKKNYHLFMEDFFPNFNEYIKKFIKQQEIERQKDIVYQNQIYFLQKHIAILKSKINKCQNEKEHLMKVMILQICIKEKKMNIPEYYKDILVNNFTKEDVKEKYGTNINIDDKDIERILKYKDSLDSNEEEILFEKLKRLQKDNIKLLTNYNKERLNIFNLKRHKNQIKEEIKKDAFNDIDNLIVKREKELENAIKKNKALSQDKSFLVKKKAKKKTKQSKLYYKVKKLFDNLNDYIKMDFSNDKEERIKGELTEEIQIIQIIKKIERIAVVFFEKNRQLLINNREEIKNYKNMIAKKKKIEKTNEQKRNIYLRMEKERKKIYEKYTKILFLQRRKVPMNTFDKKIIIQKSKSQQKIKFDRFEDYLYDLKNDK